MVVSANTVEELLNRQPAWVPQFKGMEPAEIRRLIYESTGYKLRTKTEPRAHQLEGLGLALYRRSALLLFSMRLGKTKVALDWAWHLRRAGIWRFGKGLVVAHSPLGLSVWQAEVAKHSDFKIRTVRSTVDEFMTAYESDCDLIAIPRSGLQALFSIKKFSKRKEANKRYPDEALIKLAADAFGLYISDEIHAVKRATSLWFNIEAGITRHCNYRLGLTGTPIGRDPFAVWAEAFLIDGGRVLGNHYHIFEQAYGRKQENWYSPRKMVYISKKTGKPVIDKRTGKPKLVGYDWVFDKNKMELLSDKISGISMSYEFAEVHDVTTMASVVHLPMSQAQQEMYDQAIDKIIKLNKVPDPIILGNTFARLRQIASGYVPYVGESGAQEVVMLPGASKIAWLDDLLAMMPEDMQAVIFHDFTESGRLICGRLKLAKITHGWIHGGRQDNAKTVGAFQRREIQVIVANAATGGMSIDLSGADYICFFESPVDSITRQQAEARPLANREGRALVVDDLICSPVEAKILEYVREGKDAMRELRKNPQLSFR